MRFAVLHSKLKVESPCTQAWSEMTGGTAERHCESCQRQVHNFAAMTPRQINRTIFENEGHLCARITRRADGSLVTACELAGSGLSAKAATLLLGAALSTAAARAQSNPNASKAAVSGRFTDLNGGPLPSQGYVVFASNGQSILETKTDRDGNWKAEIEPGTYDVIFRTSVIFGERVNAVRLHAGEQEFSAVHGRVAYGHLGLVDEANDTVTLVGEIGTSSYRPPVTYLFRHPVRFLRYLTHNLS